MPHFHRHEKLGLYHMHLISVLGEPSFKSLADIETPTGMSSDCSSASLSTPEEASALQEASAPEEASAVLSSTAIEGASSLQPDNLDVSCIESDVLFCYKCGQVFQKYVLIISII